MDTQTVIHTDNEKFSAIKRNLWKKNELMIHATTCMNCKHLMLWERTEIQKPEWCLVPFIVDSGKDKTLVMENRSVLARGYR